MRKTLMWMLAAGCCVGSYATDARVVSMGRHDAFFMDEVSIFRNPANISIYPNMVYGSIGVYKPDTILDNVGSVSAMQKYNRDPVNPFWGGTISYSLENGTDGGNQYPMLSLGAMINRQDEMLDYITMGSGKFIGKSKDTIADPVGKLDLLLGYVLKNGGMLGGGIYGAIQKDQSSRGTFKNALYKGNLGLNWPIAKTMDLEVSVGGGMITCIADSGGVRPDTLAHNNYFARVEARLFSALTAVNGDFVPHLRLDVLELDRVGVTKFDLAAGIGINLNIDKGFFWGGLEFLYGQKDSSNFSAKEYVGGRVSFGVERNIWTDWLVIRVGGQKSIVFMKDGSNSRYLESASADQSDQDMVGVGFGINIDNRLRIDFVAAEDLFFTLSNLFSAPQHHMFNRVSATYSF